MNQDFVELGSRLKREREGRALKLSDVSRVTKIPERSLHCLEEGNFEELPGEVFVRGFLRSYARCVGLDGEDLVRRYGEVTHKSEGSHPPVADRVDEDRQEVSETAVPPKEEGVEMNLIARAIADAGRGTQRVSLTLAVIILVIVATLTLSLLLRRPDRHGDGLSVNRPAPASLPGAPRSA